MKTLNTIGIAMLVGYFLLMLLNGNKIASTVKAQAQSLVNVQQTTTQHTADANAVIDWAAGK
jgi:cell division protein FtsX